MKKFKTVKVKYIDSVQKIGNDYFPRYKQHDVCIEYVKQYYNGREHLIGLNSCSRDLIDFLTAMMDENNICGSDVRTVSKFKGHMEARSKESGMELGYAEVTIRKAYKELEKRNCLIKLVRGIFQVNPSIFFRGTEAERLGLIKKTREVLQKVRDEELELKYVIREIEKD